MSARITHFEIFGQNPHMLAAFYAEIFQWQLEKMEGMDYWRIKVPGNENNLYGGLTYKYLEKLSGWLFYVHVESLNETVEKIVKHGGAIVRPKTAIPRVAWITIVADPAGNVFGVWEADPDAFPMPEPD